MTTPENKVKILAELWTGFRDNPEFAEFIEYNDIGLPLAYFIFADIVQPTPKADIYISETFDILVASFGLDENVAYEDFPSMLQAASQKFDMGFEE